MIMPPLVPVAVGTTLDRPDEDDTRLTAVAIRDGLIRLGYRSCILEVDRSLAAVDGLRAMEPSVVFNLVETIEADPAFAPEATRRLDQAGLGYTGAGTVALASTVSKIETKRRLRAAGLPTPAWSEDGLGLPPDQPVIVKSDAEHASLGLDASSVVPGARAASEIAARQRRFGGRFFAEAYIDGREFNLALIGGRDDPVVLPPAEIRFVDFPPDRPRIVDYDAKWADGSFAFDHTPRHFDFGADDADLLERLAVLSREVWRLFGASGYARVDFRVDRDGAPSILEINLNPCIAPDAGFTAAAARAGLTFDAMIATILAAAGACAWRDAVTPADVGAIRDLVTATGMFSREEIDIAGELVAERLEKGPASGYDFILAERDGRLAGYACYGPIPGSEVSFDLYWIAVDPRLQKGGLGRQILCRVEGAIRGPASRQLYADTSSSAAYAPTRAFYERTGFAVAATFADFYRPGDGKVIFRKIVAPGS